MASGTLTCQFCGETFTPRNKRGPKPKFCKPAHRQRAYEWRKLAELIEKLENSR